MSESKPKLFDSLTGMRGISAIMVIITHCISTDLEGKTFVGTPAFGASGDMSVFFFFALSGFLLTYKAYCEILQTPKEIPADKKQVRSQIADNSQEDNVSTVASMTVAVGINNLNKSAESNNSTLKLVKPTKMDFIYYTIRRFFRIYPAYALVLLFSGDTGIPNPLDERFLKRVFLLPTSNYAQFWTIRVELAYYMMIPFLQLLSYYALKLEENRKNNNQKHIPFHLILLSAITALAIWLCFIGRIYSPADPINRPPIYQYMPIFWFGSLTGTAYFYIKQNKCLQHNFEASEQRKIYWAAEIMSYIILFLIILTNKYSSITILGKETWLCQVQASVMSPLYGLLILLLVFTNETISLGRFFACNLFLWTGKASYSIYLIQYAAINLVFRGFSYLKGIEANILVIIFACLFGWFLFKGVEERSVNIGNLLIKKLKTKNEKPHDMEVNLIHNDALKKLQIEPLS